MQSLNAVISIWCVVFGVLHGAELELTSAAGSELEKTSAVNSELEHVSAASISESQKISAANSEFEYASATSSEVKLTSAADSEVKHTPVANSEVELTSVASGEKFSNLPKPGICPRLSLESQPNCFNTESRCDFDADCQDDQKCCNSGCGNTCTYPAFTGCQQLRTLISKQSSSVNDEKKVHVPKCQENGMFEDVQCDDMLGKCWCVDDLGFELAGTRENASHLVNCSNPRPCADVLCRMLCPYGFELDTEGCPLCRCRNPCLDVQCPAEQECHLEEIPCAEDICPPLPTCKRPRRLEDLCPMGTPLSSPESGNPFLCGTQPNKPQCPPNFLCDVMPGNDYGVCCPLVDKHGRCPTELHFGDACGSSCNADMDCGGSDKCCTIEGCGMTCTRPANTTLCLQQKAVVELLLSGRDEYEGYIPQCTEDGEFVPMQCSSNGHLCWCVTVNGTIVSGTMAPREKVECEGQKLEFEGRTQSEGGTDVAEIDVSFVCNQLNCDYKCEAGYKYDGKGCRTCECLEPCKDITCPDGRECILTRDDHCFDNDCPLIPVCRDTFVECNWGRALLSNLTGWATPCQKNECPDTHFCEIKHGKGLCCPKQVEIEHTKDSECPDYIYEPNQCDHICKSDSHCQGIMKCCPSKACGAVCVLPKPPKPPTMCEYIRDSGNSMVRPDGNATLAIPQPQCQLSGAYSPMQCDGRGECWCVDEFGVEITKTRSTGNLDCHQIREEMACLGLICRLGCDFGFVMDEDGCPLCSCRNPCQNASCGAGESCQFLEVECDDDWCPPLPYCVPSEAVARNFPECPMGSPMLYEYDNEPVMCDPFSNYPQCPNTHDCVVSNPRDLGVCCPRVVEIPTTEQERKGQCPYLIPVLGESCDYQCSLDIDCDASTKCCSNGCGTQCVEPVMKTACQHLKSAAEHRAIEMGIPASHIFMPNCTETGSFASVQCNPVDRNCWCVDESGVEIRGTRIRGREQVTCIPVVDDCGSMLCDSVCPHGYEVDANGCLTCECKDPCKDVKCRISGESCRLVTVNCISEPCTPLPLCLPKIENPCPIGEPLTDGEFGNVQCGPQGEQCPSSHRCHLSPFGEYAVCCPKQIISTCEQLKKRNQQLRKAINRVTFLPKCNKKTGAWDPTQCMEALGLCWCVDPEGNQLPGTLIRGVPHCTARSGKSIENTPICNDGEAVHICPADLCKGKVCLGYPNATCNVDPCGGCKVQFLNDYNKPVDCNNGITACFAEVQGIINTGILRPKNTPDDDVLPELEYMTEEMLPLPPPVYPPPPPPPQFLKVRREAVFDYDYDNNNLFEYGGPEYEDADMQALQTSEPSIMVLPKVHSIQIKMMPQFSEIHVPPMSPVINPIPIQAFGEFLGSEPVEVYGVSHRFTFMDDPTVQSFRDNSDPYMQPYSADRPGQCPLPNLFSILRSMVDGQANQCEHSCRLDSDCEWPNKCCLYNLCGLQCHPPAWKVESRQDQDKCPPISTASVNPFMCLFAKRSCFGDQDCSDNDRCCATICGPQCITVKGKKNVVKPVKLQAAAPRCSVEGGYAITQKQGELSWCVDQYGQPLHDTLTRGFVECDNNGSIISLQRNGPVCQNKNKIPRICKDECIHADCPEHHDAICLADPCNDCAVEFISPDGFPVSCEGKCKQSLLTGSCSSSLTRYHFNQSSMRCEQFIYKGCKGNDNNFEMLQQCQEECEKQVPRCDQPKEVGLCRAQIYRWFYNRNTYQCEQFIYGGCSGNENNFETREECERTCPELVVCPWINVNGEDIVPCNRSAACANMTCPGKPEAICSVDSCSCQPYFVDYEGRPLACSPEEQHVAEESSPSLRTAALSEITRCQSMLKRHLISGDSTYIPLCNENGEFYPMQCSREKNKKETQCWCVDEAGMQLPSSQKFDKGTKNCKFVQVKKVEVTLAFTHADMNYAETMKPAIKRLIEQFLQDLGAEFTEVKIAVHPRVTHVMFTLLSDNKVQIAFQLEEMMKMENIFIVLPKAEMSVDYHSSHFFHVLEYSSEIENSIAADRINEILAARSDYNWPFFAIFLAIACMILFLIFYVIPVVIRKRKKEKELEIEDKEKPSLLSVAFRTVRYNLTGKKDNVAVPPEEAPKVVVQTVEAEYESLQKKDETEKSETSEAPPAYDDISEKGADQEADKH